MQNISNRQLFLRHIAQTSAEPIGIEMVSASGIYLSDAEGKKYMDLISGFNVANIGHSNPLVIEAVQKQAASYMHLIVYGEFIESPQVQYASLLTKHLPENLNCVYFTNSGAEATEGAMKLAKRYTGRPNIISFKNAYHGSTQGALSLMGNEYWKNAYRPLLPGILEFEYGEDNVLEAINEKTAAVFAETIQAESGVKKPPKEWLNKVKKKCRENDVLLVLDEIQAGFGRSGTLWAFEQFDVEPDILLLGKALGGGMPLGAFISSKKIMDSLMDNPVLGHITTFGGHPVSCAAGLQAFKILLEGNFIEPVFEKEKILMEQLSSFSEVKLHTAGLWASLAFSQTELCRSVIHQCIKNGLITDWFLFAPDHLRIAPPLIITNDELINMCTIINQSISEVCHQEA
ncbi:MAG: aspartate aminotransferase family protein [Bacteroidetes bacterium]|nr:aspartate aminotransferase family protein [Bacteroidota bacterium]